MMCVVGVLLQGAPKRSFAADWPAVVMVHQRYVFFFHSEILKVKRLGVFRFERGGHVFNADLVDDLAEVPGGQHLLLVFLFGEEDLASVGTLNI